MDRQELEAIKSYLADTSAELAKPDGPSSRRKYLETTRVELDRIAARLDEAERERDKEAGSDAA